MALTQGIDSLANFLPESDRNGILVEKSSRHIPLSNQEFSDWFKAITPESQPPYFRIIHPKYEVGVSQSAFKRLGIVKQDQLVNLEQARDFLIVLPKIIPATEDFLPLLSRSDQLQLINRLFQTRALNLEMLEILVRDGMISASVLSLAAKSKTKEIKSLKIDYQIGDRLWGKMVLELIRDSLRVLVLNQNPLPEFCAPWLVLAKRLRLLAWRSWFVAEGAEYLLSLRLNRRLASWFGSLEFWAGFKSFVSAEAWNRLIGDFSKSNRAFLETQSTTQIDPTLDWLDANWLQLIQDIGKSELHEPRWHLSRVVDLLKQKGLLSCLVAYLGISDTYRLASTMPGLTQPFKAALGPELRAVYEGYSSCAIKPEFEFSNFQKENALHRVFNHGILILLLSGHFEL